MFNFFFLGRVEKSNYFRRDGADVFTDANISLSQAILGGSIRVQGVYDDHVIQITPGTSSHARINLSNKGLKRVNSYGHGNHYVNLKIAIPKKLNEKQKALIQVSIENMSNLLMNCLMMMMISVLFRAIATGICRVGN